MALRELLLNLVKAKRVRFIPFGEITSINVQDALEEMENFVVSQTELDAHTTDQTNPHVVTKTQVSLSDVTNDAQVKKLSSSTDDNVPTWNGTTGDALNDGYPVETILSGDSAKLARADAIKTYIDGLIGANDAMTFEGVIDCSGNPNYPAADAGHNYKVSVAGKIGGGSGPNVEVGDMLLCCVDATGSGDHATVGANWNVIQVNIDGAVVGPTSSTDHAIARFDSTSGKIIQNSTITLDDSGNMSVKLDNLGSPDDNTDLDATDILHGLMSKNDKGKLDAVESGATADLSGSEIKTLYEAEANAYTDAKDTKLTGIESLSTADQTGAEIKSVYEVEANAYTDTKNTKLSGIEDSANNYSLPTASDIVKGGAKVGARLTISTETLSADIQSDNNFTTTLKNKLDGVEDNATVDQNKADIDALGLSHDSLSDVSTDDHHAQSHNAASHSDIAETGANIDDAVSKRHTQPTGEPTAYVIISAGAGDSGKGIKLDALGHVDGSALNDADVDHVNIASIGSNTHTQIDTHLGSSTNPHTVTKTQVSLGNVTDNAQVKKLAVSTSGNVPTWNGTTGDALNDGLGVQTALGNPGSDANLVTEQGMREAVTDLPIDGGSF